MSIEFEGELGSGDGVVREWLTELSRQLFAPSAGVFWQYPGNSTVVHPVMTSSMDSEQQAMMQLAGTVAGQT